MDRSLERKKVVLSAYWDSFTLVSEWGGILQILGLFRMCTAIISAVRTNKQTEHSPAGSLNKSRNRFKSDSPTNMHFLEHVQLDVGTRKS